MESVLSRGWQDGLQSSAFAAAPWGMLVLDASGVIRIANAAARRLLARDDEGLRGARLDAFADALHHQEIANLIERATRGERPTRRELRFLRPDGSVRYGGFTVAPMDAPGGRAVVAVIRDVTEEHLFHQQLVDAEIAAKARLAEETEQRRQAEGTRLRVEQGLRLLLDTVPDLVVVTTQGRIVHVNEVAVRGLGHERDGDLVGRLVFDLVHPDDRAETAQRATDVLEQQRRVPPRMVRMLHRDGSYREIECVTLPLVFDGRSSVLTLGRDLTERRKIEAQLALGERLVAMGTLAAGIGHEINNPLAYLIGNLDLLHEELAADALDRRELQELLGDCRDGAERIRRIVPGLKGLARARDEQRRPLDIARVVEPALAMTMNEIRHRAKLVRDYGPTPLVEADEGRLTQVFVNLLVNAAQAIPDGHADANEIRVRTSTDASGRAVVEVKDTGVGIAEENLRRIFEPFFTSKAIGEGTGLGLSISHGIVSALGGAIDAESTVGKGSTFRVVLPPAAPAPRAESAPSTSGAPAARRGRVLVVDDEPAIVSVVQRILGPEHDVVTAHSGREALAILGDGARFDVVLCDLMMPDVNGMDVHARLTVEAPDVAPRMVFVTGGAFSSAARAFLQRVPNERLEKPFDTRTLRSLVRRIVGPPARVA